MMKQTKASGILLLLLIGVLASVAQTISPAQADSGTFGNDQIGSYVDPSYVLLPDGTYRFTTSFGTYDIKPYHGFYVFGLRAVESGPEIGWGSYYPLYNTVGDSSWRTNALTYLTPVDSPNMSPLSDHWQMNWNVKVSGQQVGNISLIAQFSRTAYPKISVSLTKTCATWLTDPYGKQICSLTVWDSLGLKNMRWTWLTVPAVGYDNYRGSVVASASLTDNSEVSTTTETTFTGVRSWFVDWHEHGAQTVRYVKASNYFEANRPALVTLFPVNMLMIDPTFGLTSTGSTSYPTAKAVTANGNAQIDTAQSKFGDASGLFDGTDDFFSLANSAAWDLSGDFTLDLQFRTPTLPDANVAYNLFHFYQDSTHYWKAELFNEYGVGGPWSWRFRYNNGGGETGVVWKEIPSIAVNTWYHVEFVRSSNSWYVFQDGTQVGTTVTNSVALPDLTGTLYIGAFAGADDFALAWYDEIRISNIARHTSDFTAPTARYNRDFNIDLLLHNDGADTSTTFLDDVTTGVAKASWFRLTDNNAALSSVSFYTHTAGYYRVSIWNDTGATAPDNLLWESGDTAASATTWNNVTISSGSPSSLSLQSGIVWLVWQWNPGAAYAAGPSYTAGSANNGTYLYQAYGAFPASWSGIASAEQWSIFVTYATSSTTYTTTKYTTLTTTTTTTPGGTTTFPTTSVTTATTTTTSGTTTITSTTVTTSATVTSAPFTTTSTVGTSTLEPFTSTSTNGTLTFPTTTVTTVGTSTITSDTTTTSETLTVETTTVTTNGTTTIGKLTTTSTSESVTYEDLETTTTSATSTIDPLTTTSTNETSTIDPLTTTSTSETTTFPTTTVTTSGTTTVTSASTTTSDTLVVTTTTVTTSGTMTFDPFTTTSTSETMLVTTTTVTTSGTTTITSDTTSTSGTSTITTTTETTLGTSTIDPLTTTSTSPTITYVDLETTTTSGTTTVDPLTTESTSGTSTLLDFETTSTSGTMEVATTTVTTSGTTTITSATSTTSETVTVTTTTVTTSGTVTVDPLTTTSTSGTSTIDPLTTTTTSGTSIIDPLTTTTTSSTSTITSDTTSTSGTTTITNATVSTSGTTTFQTTTPVTTYLVTEISATSTYNTTTPATTYLSSITNSSSTWTVTEYVTVETTTTSGTSTITTATGTGTVTGTVISGTTTRTTTYTTTVETITTSGTTTYTTTLEETLTSTLTSGTTTYMESEPTTTVTTSSTSGTSTESISITTTVTTATTGSTSTGNVTLTLTSTITELGGTSTYTSTVTELTTTISTTIYSLTVEPSGGAESRWLFALLLAACMVMFLPLVFILRRRKKKERYEYQ